MHKRDISLWNSMRQSTKDVKTQQYTSNPCTICQNKAIVIFPDPGYIIMIEWCHVIATHVWGFKPATYAALCFWKEGKRK